MKHGFFRVAAASVPVRVAGCDYNTANICDALETLAAEGVEAVVFPEMCVTAYTCGDLFHNRTLLDSARRSLREIAEFTAELPACPLVAVGCPVEVCGSLYNCAVVIESGRVLAVIPKTYLPNYNEFYEKRWWSAAPERSGEIELWDGGGQVSFGTDIIVEHHGVCIGFEICEDLWTPVPPSSFAAMEGAHVIMNLSASDDLIGKYDYLFSLVRQQSARTISAYVYASAAHGESSTDLVFDSKLIVAENGTLLASNKRWQTGIQSVIADVDIEAVIRDRMHTVSFEDCRRRNAAVPYRCVRSSHSSALEPYAVDDFMDLRRRVDSRPFVPADDSHLSERCEEIINIQVAGLCKRLEATRCKSLTIGISGGLDSTLALLVAVRAFDILGLPRTGIIAVTMPGYGTTGRTYRNAVALVGSLGATLREISIVDAVNQHFADIGHDSSVHDVTYENSQARERTQILMDIANQTSGMVLGTGDLSELALGWATYNGDHMSMYAVNSGVPKTLVRHLTRYFAFEMDDKSCRETLFDIIDTPISPELLPADSSGDIAQKTEDLVGPYDLHDFFLYYTLRYGFTPSRIYLLARTAFDGEFSDDEIRKWLKVFFRRFFSQQFKRSCLPDGPKVGSVCLSPRGDWRMPSDASAELWLAECDRL